MKRTNLLIGLLFLAVLFLYLSRSENLNSNDAIQELEIKKIVSNNGSDDSATASSVGDATDKLPEDIQKALAKPESHDPNELPPDLKAQLDAPPPELPEDLKRQLALPPQELPADLKAQLNSPPPELPEDIKKALAMPPRVVTLDEVNTPPDLNEDTQ